MPQQFDSYVEIKDWGKYRPSLEINVSLSQSFRWRIILGGLIIRFGAWVMGIYDVEML